MTWTPDRGALTARLNPKTERLLNALAKRRRQTRSDVVREAIEAYAAADETQITESTPYEQWADVIGGVRMGGRDPSKTTGELFTDIVREKVRARRSR